jgi:Trk K+ transport system NAD-binding subunit
MRVTIVGCGYVGEALARLLGAQPQSHLTLTTTREQRRAELESLGNRVLVLKASDAPALK